MALATIPRLTEDLRSPEQSSKVFHIFGWKSNGCAIVRSGVLWATPEFGQTRAFLRTVLDFPLGARKSLPFKTAAGQIAYEVERVK